MFSRYSVNFKSGNPTISKLISNIVTSMQDPVPKAELMNVNWAIDRWLDPCMVGLSDLMDHHGFLIKRHEDRDNEVHTI